MKMNSIYCLLAAWFVLAIPCAFGELKIHGIFNDNMVIQRQKPVDVWGTAKPGANVVVEFSGQKHTGQADPKGNWKITLDSMEANSTGQTMQVQTEGTIVRIQNILVGDVWLCGGQSNMEFSLERIYQGDIEIASARHPEIRLLTIPKTASPESLDNFQAVNEFNSWNNEYELKGSWQVCSPQTVNRFASIGYIFGRRIHLATGIPIGMIDNSVGGTTVEGWTSRKSLMQIPEATGLLEDWDTRIAKWDAEKDLANRVARWNQDAKKRLENGKQPRPKPEDLKPGPSVDRNNPGASYNGMLTSFSGFRLRGVIFHQGYNNALGDSRPKLYAKTLKAMVGDWRNAFNDPELPFGIIELCAGAEPQTEENFELRMVDAGPYIREAQFKVFLELNNMGWGGAYDQQVNWYHPQMKVMLAERMARWALASEYEMKRIGHAPALMVSHNVVGDKVLLAFDKELTVRDGRPIAGMAIAGEDKRFYPADAKFAVKKKDDRGRDVLDFRTIEVSSPFVESPKAVRYAWARCPLGNVTNRAHFERIIPLPSFRTDRWDWPEAPFGNDQSTQRRMINELRNKARKDAKDRMRRQAELRLAQ